MLLFLLQTILNSVCMYPWHSQGGKDVCSLYNRDDADHRTQHQACARNTSRVCNEQMEMKTTLAGVADLWNLFHKR